MTNQPTGLAIGGLDRKPACGGGLFDVVDEC
jgi:hypothetical protein